MKAIKQTIVRLVVGCVLALGLCTNSHAQQLQFTRTLATDERAIQLHWQSGSNAAYRVEFLPELLSSNNVWDVLYDDYPSHKVFRFEFMRGRGGSGRGPDGSGGAPTTPAGIAA
ncbi:MAG: hypothetical protein MUF81_20695, partial [Verrucomicrobia bacterium]|nr:hypothetical protein [Verrucomicrobiota bacterium]